MHVLELHELSKEHDDRKQYEYIELLVDQRLLQMDLGGPVHPQQQ